MRVCLWIKAKMVTIATNLRVITTDLSGNNLEDIYIYIYSIYIRQKTNCTYFKNIYYKTNGEQIIYILLTHFESSDIV